MTFGAALRRCAERLSRGRVLKRRPPTEFGKTPLFSLDQMRGAGVRLILYPLTAFRMMSAAAMRAYETLRKQGTQVSLLEQMQTRDELYDMLGYHDYERKLDALFARREKQDG